MRGLALLAALLPSPALAHPHIWVDAGVEVIFDAEGRAEALRITWAYDAFSSLLFTQERGIDPDADGNATPAENAALSGLDMNWDPGFPGDAYALAGDAALTLSRPSDWTAEYKAGVLTTSHQRAIEPAVAVSAATPLIVRLYDPGFYTDYAIASAPRLNNAPAGCKAAIFGPDPLTLDQQLLDALGEYGADVDLEADFPAVGAQFADEVQVTCD